MKGLVYILIALFIDSLQLMLSLSIAAAGSALGLLTGISLPMGFVIGFAINFTISLVIGTPLVLALAMNGMFAPVRTFVTYFAEIIPAMNNLPVWTTLVVLCLLRSRASKGGVGGMISGVVSLAVPGGQLSGAASTTKRLANVRAVTAAMHPSVPERSTSSPRVALQDIRVSRPANDNVPKNSYGMAA